jgi:hypothetical protein
MYTVDRAIAKRNDNGGAYYKFLLVRVPDQWTLDQICASSPSRQQMRDERRMRWLQCQNSGLRAC